MRGVVRIRSVSELHRLVGVAAPTHPLITVLDMRQVGAAALHRLEAQRFELGLYAVSLKKIGGSRRYGRGPTDFAEGTLVFLAPQQLITYHPDQQVEEGWALYFHPDLIYASGLGQRMHTYTFFSYAAHEALHLSEAEKGIVNECVRRIEQEYSQNIDGHTHGLLVSNLELLLNYCARFYGRQFYTRKAGAHDVVQQFEPTLVAYFAQDMLLGVGLPDVKYFATRLNLSPNYLSDLLNRHTGKSTQEHIHLHLIARAKSLLGSTAHSISEVAYRIGFEHPSHFNKLFKAKTGQTPRQYRQLSGTG